MRIFIGIVLVATIAISSAFAQMEVEVGGKIEAQVGFKGKQATVPLLISSEARQEWFPFIDEVETVGVKRAIVTDSLIDIWATGTYDYECLGKTTYGAKIELFADPTSNKYSMDSWNFTFADGNVISIEGFIPGFPNLTVFTPVAVPNPGPAREAKIFLENKFGKFEIGDTIGVSKHLQVDAATVAVGNGGIAGDARLWATPLSLIGMFGSADMITNKVAFYYVDPFFSPLFATSTPLGATTNIFTSNGIGTEMRYTGKVSYFTPRYDGLVAGLSYIPDTDVFGSVSQLSNISRHDSPFGLGFKNVVEGGINYDCKIYEVGVKASILGEVGKTKEGSILRPNFGEPVVGCTEVCGNPTTCNVGGGPCNVICMAKTVVFGSFVSGANCQKWCSTDCLSSVQPPPGFVFSDTKNLRAYEFGLGFDYCCVEVAGSYGVNRPLIVGLKDNRYWTLGAAYKICNFGISLNYMDNRQKSKLLKEEQESLFDEIKYREFVVDVEYRICDGLIPYASFARFDVSQPFNYYTQSRFKQGIALIGLRILF